MMANYKIERISKNYDDIPEKNTNSVKCGDFIQVINPMPDVSFRTEHNHG